MKGGIVYIYTNIQHNKKNLYLQNILLKFYEKFAMKLFI